MKTLDEKFTDYIIVSRDGYDEFFITKRANFEKSNLCDCFDNYGQEIGCFNSGCYSIDNSGSSANKDCKEALLVVFPILNKYTFDIDSYNVINFVDEEQFENEYERDNIDDGAISEFIKEWRIENESHTEVTAWTYWDGSNHKSLGLEAYFGEPDVNEIDEVEEHKILAEFDETIRVSEGASICTTTENYIFCTTIYSNDPWLATVESL